MNVKVNCYTSIQCMLLANRCCLEQEIMHSTRPVKIALIYNVGLDEDAEGETMTTENVQS